MQVQKIMTKKVILVRQNEKVVKVARLLDKFQIHGLPVVDKNNKIAGIITESDFFIKSLPGLHLPSYIDFLKKAKFAKRLSKKQKQETNQLIEATAKDIMTEDCFCVEPRLEIKELIKIFKNKHIYTIPVIDKNQKVIGIVTMADIIKLI